MEETALQHQQPLAPTPRGFCSGLLQRARLQRLSYDCMKGAGRETVQNWSRRDVEGKRPTGDGDEDAIEARLVATGCGVRLVADEDEVDNDDGISGREGANRRPGGEREAVATAGRRVRERVGICCAGEALSSSLRAVGTVRDERRSLASLHSLRVLNSSCWRSTTRL